MQHGDPYVRALVKHILNQVAEPVKIILSRWIYEGELDDAFNEVCNVWISYDNSLIPKSQQIFLFGTWTGVI